MPSQLLSRLQKFLNEDKRVHVMNVQGERTNDVLGAPEAHPDHPNKPAPNTHRHWPGGSFGTAITSPQSVVIHGTGGWPSFASADNFKNLYECVEDWAWHGRWVRLSGYGPQYFVDPNGTAFSLIGPANFAGDPLLTWHAEELNHVSVGIENSDVADSDAFPVAGYWFPLSTAAQDLTGLKAQILLHPHYDPDAVVAWFAQFPDYTGPGDLTTDANGHLRVNPEFGGWKNMLFTERNYRTLALLGRMLSAQLGIPRNFPLFPYLTRHNDCRDEILFRQMILADPMCDTLADKLGTTTAAIKLNDRAYHDWYHTGDYVKTYPAVPPAVPRTENRNPQWTKFFGADAAGAAFTPCFKGFISHVINGDHPCPGPLFDWHRFAREMWDWWWYPFDVQHNTTGAPTVSTAVRGYRAARRDTPLIEYYYDQSGTTADYNTLRDPATPAGTLPERFVLPALTPIHAMANGVVVAGRLNANAPATDPSFLLTRHEVYSQTLTARANDTRLDYDHPPTVVWSLISFMTPQGFDLGRTNPANPDWLNRTIMRQMETSLANQFWGAHPQTSPANATATLVGKAFAHTPVREVAGTNTGDQINRDSSAYDGLLNALRTGDSQVFPLEDHGVTPVRVILGDFLGLPATLSGTSHGIQIEIFSKDKLDVPGAVQRVSSAAGRPWYTTATGALRHEGAVEKDLPEDGNAWHYPVLAFLTWLNTRTWQSEWVKYGVTLADKTTPAPAPDRPNTRIISP